MSEIGDGEVRAREKQRRPSNMQGDGEVRARERSSVDLEQIRKQENGKTNYDFPVISGKQQNENLLMCLFDQPPLF